MPLNKPSSLATCMTSRLERIYHCPNSISYIQVKCRADINVGPPERPCDERQCDVKQNAWLMDQATGKLWDIMWKGWAVEHRDCMGSGP